MFESSLGLGPPVVPRSKLLSSALSLVWFLPTIATAQGTFAFQNLDFESANVAAYQPGAFTGVPISAALPGWSGTIGNVQVDQVVYDTFAIAGGSISIMDSRAAYGLFIPLQGSYSALLLGADLTFPNIPATISQTGVIPRGRRSLVVNMHWEVIPPIVSMNGQVIPMIPIQEFPNYSVYAGDITSFAGKLTTLSFTAPGTTVGGVGGPSFLELDNIAFSNVAVPEPNTMALMGLAALLFGVNKRTTLRFSKPYSPLGNRRCLKRRESEKKF